MESTYKGFNITTGIMSGKAYYRLYNPSDKRSFTNSQTGIDNEAEAERLAKKSIDKYLAIKATPVKPHVKEVKKDLFNQ